MEPRQHRNCKGCKKAIRHKKLNNIIGCSDKIPQQPPKSNKLSPGKRPKARQIVIWPKPLRPCVKITKNNQMKGRERVEGQKSVHNN